MSARPWLRPLLLAVGLVAAAGTAEAGGQAPPCPADAAAPGPWARYVDREDGYAFRHPPGWAVTADGGGYALVVPSGSPQRFALAVSPLRRRGDLGLPEFVHDDTAYRPDSTMYAEESTGELNGRPVYHFTKVLGSRTVRHAFVLRDAGRGVDVSYTLAAYVRETEAVGRIERNPAARTYRRIIATFCFTEERTR